MTQRSFVHLHCHSHYSLLDGANRLPELVDRVKKLGMNACALTDHGNLYGAIEFYKTCRDANINPVIGYEAYIAPSKRTDREARRRGEAGFHLTLLAQNAIGFKNLVKMASLAFLEGYHYVPRIDKELLEAYKEGIICLSGCASGEFSELILKEQLDEAAKLAEWFHTLFGQNFFIEIQNNGLDIQKRCAEGAIDVANRLGLPLVATCDAHYLTQADAGAHDVLLCINTGKTLKDENRLRYGSDQFYIRSPAEMYQLFPGQAEAVQRSQEIADKVDIQLDFKKRHFPVFTPPDHKKPEDYLRELCQVGLHERYGPQPPQKAIDRLEHELNIICRMGFAGYFLIVSDFVRFARSKGIPASARGSACGALVSYVLQLSHVDPLEYDLLFERFLDPNRSEAPDIDIDFCQDRREEVLNYVRQKYGENSVAQIVTFGTLAAKAAIRDVGRVLDLPLDRVNRLTNLVPKVLNITLEEALQQSPELLEDYNNDPEVHKLIDIAMKLEGTNRNAGTHAAGVVIANGPLIDFVPVQRVQRKGEGAAKGGETVVTTQWVMGDLEKVGLLKMDFLGLRTLTVMENTIRLIAKTRGIQVDLQHIPMDDPATFALLQRGDAKGVFQLESDGIRELLKRMKPDNIRDLIATNALYRPGPLGGGMVDAYVNRKHGREKPIYPHPIVEEILQETWGVLVFQEQCMRILNRLGGIELASAYACIKAISKKKQDVIDQRRVEFLQGAQERGVSEVTAKEIFDLITFFAGYGFNKCLVGTTEVIDATTGEPTTLDDLHQNRRPFQVLALAENGKLISRPVTDVIWNGRKPVFELHTSLGKRIVATANHPFRTLDGWTELQHLQPGDRIAVPRQLPIVATARWPRHHLITLAGLIAEGNTCHPTSLYYFANERLLIDDFVEAVSVFPDTVARVYQRPNRRCLEVCANTGPNSRFRNRSPADNLTTAHSGQDNVQTKVRPRRSGAFRWAERLGILGKKATQKRVPAEIFQLCAADIELFLGRLWSGDGFFANANLAVPFYATSSEGLAHDVQTLLLRLGIISRIHAKQFKYRGGVRPGFTVHLLGDNSINTFVQRVVPHVVGRDHKIEQLKRHLAQVTPDCSSKDTVPAEVRAWVDNERQRVGLTWKDLETQSGVSMKEFLGRGSSKKTGFRRSTLRRLADFFASTRLGQLAGSDIFWDRVVSITPQGVEDTYDLTVAEDHNFVANGLIVHNSHSAAYAQIGYQTAYLKAHYTPEFMAALLSSEIEDSNKRDIMVQHIDDARRLKVEVLPPDIQQGEADFTVKNGQILFGLTAIKGVGRGAAMEIVRARQEKGIFRDLFDFCECMDLKIVTKAAIERLIKAGAFDRLASNRAQLYEALPRALQAAGQVREDRRHGQGSLFDSMETAETTSATEGLRDMADWPINQRLQFEKEALDFYMSSHPLAQHEDIIRRFTSHTVGQLGELGPNQEVFLGGMLTQVRFMNTKKARNGNTRYVRCKVEDFTGSAECVMWPDDYVRFKDLIDEGKICFIAGTVERTREEPGLVLTRILTLEQGQRERTSALVLMLSLGVHDDAQLVSIGRVLKRSPGSCPVFLHMQDTVGRWLKLKCSDDVRINPATLVVADLETILGPGRVIFSRTGVSNGR